MDAPMFIDMPKRMVKINPRTDHQTVIETDFRIRLAIGVIAERERLEWGEVITRLAKGIYSGGLIYKLD